MVVVDGCLLRLALSEKKKKTEITGNWRQKAIIITLNQKQKVIIIISTRERTGLWCLALMHLATIKLESLHDAWKVEHLIISLNLELGLYMMTKGMNDLTHTPLLCIPKVHCSLELLSIYFALSNLTFFYSKCTCLHTTSGQSHLHVPYVFTYIQYINACLYFYIGKCMQHNMHTLRKKTFRHKR